MSDFNTPEGDKNKKLFAPLIQNNMLITGASNIEILKGIKNGNNGYYTETNYNDFINIDLQDEYFIKGIKLCLWHFDDRYYTYDCWTSIDNKNWKEIFSGFDAQCNDTIIIMDTIRYIRLKGKNNKNDFLHIINFKII